MSDYRKSTLSKSFKAEEKQNMCMSVYDRMYNDEKLFWLGFGALYVTEMRRVNGIRSSELRIKSKGIAEKWFGLFKRYDLLSRKSNGLHEHNGIYSFGCTTQSFYRLLKVVKRIPDSEMDKQIRQRLSKLVYLNNGLINSTRINILKSLRYQELGTNELARKIGFRSGNVFRRHLENLKLCGLIKRNRKGKQRIINTITFRGLKFVNSYESEIEIPSTSTAYDECFTNKQLAADLLLIACELEMGGILERQPYLQMKSKDFVGFVHAVARKWAWTHYSTIKKIDRLNWGTTYLVGLNSNAVKDIYPLSGPCADKLKDACFKQALSLRKPGQHRKMGETREEILSLIEKGLRSSKEIALELGIGLQSIQRTLGELFKAGKLTREWKNRAYHYSKA